MSDKLKKLQSAIDSLEKDYGKGSVINLSEKQIESIPVISTGSLGLDLGLGVGGFPRGRIIEVYGPESSGKTTITLHAIAEAQKKGGIAVFIDAEHAFDDLYARNLGIDLSGDSFRMVQPDCGEQALEMAERFIRSEAVDIIVIDSVAALTPKAEIEGEIGDSKMGLHARMMSQAMRKLVAIVHKTNTTVIFINQIRSKIGVVYGSPEVTTGGNALKFYASIRLDVRKADALKDKEGNIIGNRTRVKVVKNKVAPPFKVVEFDIMYGEGISKVGEIIDLGVELEIINKSGSWYSYRDEKIGQGKEQVKSLLEDNPELLEEIEGKILSELK